MDNASLNNVDKEEDNSGTSLYFTNSDSIYKNKLDKLSKTVDPYQEIVVNIHNIYLYLAFDTKLERLYIALYKKILSKLIDTLYKINYNTLIVRYTDKLLTSNAGVIVEKRYFLSLSSQLLESIIQLQKFFYRGKPKKEGGIVFTNFFLTYNKDINDILLDLKYELEE